MTWFHPTISINHLNKTNPVTYQMLMGQFRIVKEFIYKYSDSIKLTLYNSDEGSVFDKTIKYLGYAVDSSSSNFIILPESTKLYVKDSFCILTWNLIGASANIYYRSYTKLQTVMAQIGGVMKFILTVSQVISQYVTWLMYVIDLSNICIDPVEKRPDAASQIPFKINRCINSLNQLEKSPAENNSERRELKFHETLFPSCCLRGRSKRNKELGRTASEIIPRLLSTEKLLKTMTYTENLKYLFLDEKQLKLFENIRHLTPEQHKKSLDENKLLRKNELEKLVFEMIGNTDTFSKKLISRIID